MKRRIDPTSAAMSGALLVTGAAFTWHVRGVSWFMAISGASFLLFAWAVYRIGNGSLPRVIARHFSLWTFLLMVIFVPSSLVASASVIPPTRPRPEPAPTATTSAAPSTTIAVPPSPTETQPSLDELRLTYDVDVAVHEILITRDLIVRESTKRDAACASKPRESAERQLEDARFIRAHFKPKGPEWTEQERADYERVKQALALTHRAVVKLRDCPVRQP